MTPVPAFCSPYAFGIDANRSIKDELAGAIARCSGRRRISVTDLVNPRQAYFQRTRPDIQISPDRLQVMMAGTGFHEVFERALSTEEFVEQLVEFESIVGKIDIYEDAPIELKTTGSLPSDILVSRASHVEQIAMYCVMVGMPRGHLVYYQRAEYGRPPLMRIFDLEVVDRERIAAEMIRRRDLLRDALERADPAGLPRCEWAGGRCDYEAFCGCETAVALQRMGASGMVARPNAELEARLRERMSASQVSFDRSKILLNDLVFPRKAAARLAARLEARGDTKDEDAETIMAAFQRKGFEDVLKEAIWYAAPGVSRRVRVPFGPVQASIVLYRDVPSILRVSKRREMFVRDRLIADAPHYIERLGFECALAGSDRGRLILYYAALPDDKFMVYDIWFRDLDAIKKEMRRRLDLLEAGTALANLPSCQPGWMSRFCEFAPGCGCGEAEQTTLRLTQDGGGGTIQDATRGGAVR